MDPLVGYIGVIVAAVGFATNFMVIKKWSPGDGMFFQLNMVVGIWLIGLIFHIAVRDSPPFQPFAMVGGALWATGNAMCPFIIENIGMGMGLLIWGTANMVIGWASGHFGILLVQQQHVAKPTLNIIGACVSVVSIVIYSQVKGMDAQEQAERDRKKALKKKSQMNSLNSDYGGELDQLLQEDQDEGGKSTVASRAKNRIPAFGMALLAGILFGSCFNPPQHIVDLSNDRACSKVEKYASHAVLAKHCNSINRYCDQANEMIAMTNQSLSAIDCDEMASWKGRMYCSWDDHKNVCDGIPLQDMVFSQFSGMLMTAWFWCFVYIIYKQGVKGGEPWVNKPLIGPGFVCGMVWAIAQIGWFYANDNLPQAVSFPVVATAPGILATLLGIFVYGEVSLKPFNLAKLGAAILIAGVGDAIITMSM